MSINFSINRKNHNPKFYKILSLIFFIFCFPVLCSSFAHAVGSKAGLSTGELLEFAQNNILFYDPSECIDGNSTGICGNTSEEKIWSILRQTLDPVHAAAAFGSIAREGSFQPVKWEYEKVVTLSTCSFLVSWDDLYNGVYDGKYGVGSFGLTSGLSDYLHYVNDNAPDLLQYFKDPSNTCYSTGDELAEKIGQSAVDDLIDVEVNYFINEWIPKYKGEGIYNTFLDSTDIQEAAIIWARDIEVCRDCGCSVCASDSELGPRATAAQEYYDKYKDFTCSDTDGGSCTKLKELRTAMWTKASQKDREDFMYTVSQEDHSIAGVEGYMNQALAYNDGNLSSWLDGQCKAFRGGISCRGSHTISDEEQDWINEALNGSNNIKFAVGNATGGSNVGAGKIVCVWDGTKCRDDVDYSKQGGTGVCSVYSPSADYGECWGLEMAESWVEEISTQCGSSSSDSGSTDNASNSSNSDSSDSSSNSIKWDNGWLVEGSVEGLVIEDVTNRTDLSESTVNPIGSYITDDGKPNKILLHSTEGTISGLATYSPDNMYPAHFTIDLKNKTISQHFSIYQPSMAIAKHDKAGPIQFEIVGFSTPSSSGYSSEWALKNYSDEDWDYLAKILVAISEETGIPLTSSVSWEDGADRLSSKEFLEYEGILGHMHAPDNDHTDPGNIWQYVESAIERQDGCTSYEGKYPQYNQCGESWSNYSYSTDNICGSGCGAASMAMLATVATGEDIFPDDIAKLLGNQYYDSTSIATLDPIVGDHYGFDVEVVNTSGVEDVKTKMRDYLKKGYMIHFTGRGCYPGFIYASGGCTAGHVIGLFDIDDNDMVTQANSGMGEVHQKASLDDMANALNFNVFTAIKGSGNKKSCNTDGQCNNSGSGGSVSMAGLTEDQAQKVADYYNSDKVTASNFIGGFIPSDYAKVNCVSFSYWFVSAFTDAAEISPIPSLVGDGSYIADTGLPSIGWETGNDPTAFSVFGGAGSSAWSHTGVVVGKTDDGDILTIEAAYAMYDARVMTRSPSYFSEGVGILAYPGSHFTPNEGHLGNKSIKEIIGS